MTVEATPKANFKPSQTIFLYVQKIKKSVVT